MSQFLSALDFQTVLTSGGEAAAAHAKNEVAEERYLSILTVILLPHQHV